VSYARTVRAAQGATAVQIVGSSRRGARDIEYLGPAHDEADREHAEVSMRVYRFKT
jgi:hypothetical protein